MHQALLATCGFVLLQTDVPAPGTHERFVEHEKMKRAYLVHVPPKHDPKAPAPVVLALHGATMNHRLMAFLSNLNDTADKHNFIVVYPNGTGPLDVVLTWNAGGFPGGLGKKVDDVGYLNKVLDDVESVLKVDKKRVYAAGLSNGAMMCYRMAAEMPERIAAIAAVAGTLALDDFKLKRPMSVLHFHGTKDTLVPFEGPKKSPLFTFLSVEQSLEPFRKANECPEKCDEKDVPTKDEGLKVQRRCYGPGKNNTEVVLYVIDGGGHTWPGHDVSLPFLGKCCRDLDANEIMWEFFKKHPMK